jgi:hypothetical protein
MKEGSLPCGEDQIVPVGNFKRVDDFKSHKARRQGSNEAQRAKLKDQRGKAVKLEGWEAIKIKAERAKLKAQSHHESTKMGRHERRWDGKQSFILTPASLETQRFAEKKPILSLGSKTNISLFSVRSATLCETSSPHARSPKLARDTEIAERKILFNLHFKTRESLFSVPSASLCETSFPHARPQG